jgi:hypothetical protein
METLLERNLTGFMRIVLSLLVIMTGSLNAASYRQRIDLAPTQLNASQLRAILSTLSEIIGRANPGPSENSHPHLSVEITDDGTGATVAFTDFTIPQMHLPSPATTLHVSYWSSDAPISHIDLDLGDFSRVLRIEGESYTEVTGCATLMARELSRYSVPLGGLQMRGALLFITILAITALSAFFGAIHSRWFFFFIGVQVLIGICSFLLPWSRILPGFVFHESMPSWIERYSAQLAFLGLLLTILFPVVQFVLERRAKGKVRN